MSFVEQLELEYATSPDRLCATCQGRIDGVTFKAQRRAHQKLCFECREATWNCEVCKRDMRLCDSRAKGMWERGARQWSQYQTKTPCRSCRAKERLNASTTAYKSVPARVWTCHLFCKGCGALGPFLGRKFDGCSTECTKRIRRVNHRFNRLMGFRNAQRVEPVFVGRLLLRDGHNCTECGIELLFDSSDHKDPRLASIDHIVPVSRYGDHTYENTRLVCLRCNSKRGAAVA